MHNNFYFLRQLSLVLDQKLRGFTLVSCFSQSKDELILEFNNAKTSFFVRASLLPDFCCLSFPESFSRARKNSVDLFNSVILKKVEGVVQYENERSFSISLEGQAQLLFKMHGNRANVVLLENQKPAGIFRNHLKADWDINSTELNRTIDWSKDFFLGHQDNLRKAYFTFGKEVWSYLNGLDFEDAGVETRWTLLRQTLHRLKSPEYMICWKSGQLFFSLLPLGSVIKTFDDPISAINEFYHSSTQAGAFFKEKNSALQQLNTQLESGKQYVQRNKAKLEEFLHHSQYQQWADLIMANMGQIKTGTEKIKLENFYDNNTPVEIKLKGNLNAQKNAEVYYRKAKDQGIEIQKLKESIESKEKEIESVENQIVSLEKEAGLQNLRKKINESGIVKKSQQKQPTALPYHEFEYKRFKIWVGKNAASNDKLTLKYTFKDDLWLHAKDVAGSHVVIKYQSGKNFPKDVIEHAAQLAAYHSKRKNESLCPVIVTPKKFVRKRKGDPAGAVVVEREKVILVRPAKS